MSVMRNGTICTTIVGKKRGEKLSLPGMRRTYFRYWRHFRSREVRFASDHFQSRMHNVSILPFDPSEIWLAPSWYTILLFVRIEIWIAI
jgi:hypothetical protein